MIDKKAPDPGLETLLDLDGEVFMVGKGYWTKFAACRMEQYEFESAGQLMEDFWAEVDRILK